jgi:hypothetical protein
MPGWVWEGVNPSPTLELGGVKVPRSLPRQRRGQREI